MAQKPEITLAEVRKNLPRNNLRASDLVDADKLTKLRSEAKAKSKSSKKKKLFDSVDAFGAEIIARFGLETYQKWNSGEVETEQMMRWICAERAREKANLADLEAVIIAMVGSCIRRSKKDPKPKGPGIANKIYKRHISQAKGEE